jgi:hypothetical protein
MATLAIVLRAMIYANSVTALQFMAYNNNNLSNSFANHDIFPWKFEQQFYKL